MFDYFMSSDWAIIATELLAGFFVLSLILAVLVWRGQRHYSRAAEQLLDDRDPIVRANEEMVQRQIQRIWPELSLDEEQRQIYADRSLDAVEAMVEPWLEPKRHDLTGVARQFQRVRQEDLEQLLTVARAHAEASQADDERVGELEQEVDELRKQRDRQANQLNDSLETVNVMVREYGRKFSYDKEPHVATVLKAIVMIEEMEAGADCETAQQRAEDIFSEDLVASPGAVIEDDRPTAESSSETNGVSDDSAPQATKPGDDTAVAATAASGADAETIDVGGEGTRSRDETSASTDDGSTDATPERSRTPEDSPTEAQAADDDDIDALIAQAQEAQETTAQETTANETSTQEASTQNTPTEDSANQNESSSTDADEAEQPQREASPATDDAELAQTDAQPPSEASPTPSVQADAAARTEAPEETAPTDKEAVTAEPSAPDGEEEPKAAEPAAEAESDEPASHDDEDDSEDNGVIDLDDVEIPEEEQTSGEAKEDEFDLDDIDALLDAEIAKKHGKSDD